MRACLAIGMALAQLAALAAFLLAFAILGGFGWIM